MNFNLSWDIQQFFTPTKIEILFKYQTFIFENSFAERGSRFSEFIGNWKFYNDGFNWEFLSEKKLKVKLYQFLVLPSINEH